MPCALWAIWADAARAIRPAARRQTAPRADASEAAVHRSSLEPKRRVFSGCNRAVPCRPGDSRISVTHLLATDQSHRQLLHQRLTPAALVQIALDPFVTIGALVVLTLAFGEPFGGPYLILALIVFSLTFPGSEPKGTSVRALAADVLTGWLVIVGLLLLIGWATRTLDSFDPRLIVAWAGATPVLLFVSKLLLPIVLPRVMSAEGVQRVAVIAGEGELGRELAERIKSAPFLGIRFAGYFDDRSPERLGAAKPDEVLGGLAELAEYAKTRRVDLIYITLPMAS